MVNKKSKGGGGKGGKGSSKTGNTRPAAPKAHKQHELLKEPQLAPQERVDSARPFWELLSQQERIALLTIDAGALRQRAQLMTEAMKQQQHQLQGNMPPEASADPAALDTTLEDVLGEGLRRLQDKGTWKLWSWAQDRDFYDGDSFRSFIMEKHIPEDLQKFLPREDTKAPEKPAEAAFRQRMVALLQKVQQSTRQNLEENNPTAVRAHRRKHGAGSDGAVPAARDSNVELVNIMLEALEQEHECLYQSLLQPIIAYVMLVLPAGCHETSKSELAFEDLEKLSPEHAVLLAEWLTEKVDALSTKLKADPKEEGEPEEDEENMGDVDLWSVVDDGKALTVNEKWLQHLQERLLGEEGHPRKARPGEDPRCNGLVLEWVYGLIVSTAEKARDGAKRPLGPYVPVATEAHSMLLRALEDFYLFDARGRQAKELMSEMLKSRLELQELTKQCEEWSAPKAAPAGGEQGPDPAASAVPEEQGCSPLLPDHVVVAMLRREALLTKARLHHLVFEQLQQDKLVRSLKAQLRQGEPEFERLKRELDEVKHQHRGLDGTYRSTAEMERHRAQLADAAIEEQLEVQTAFREQGARLQAIYDRKQRSEFEMSKREVEVKQLQGWKGTVENLVEKFQDVLLAMGLGAAAPGAAASSHLGASAAVAGAAAKDAGAQGGVLDAVGSSAAAGLADSGQAGAEAAEAAGAERGGAEPTEAAQQLKEESPPSESGLDLEHARNQHPDHAAEESMSAHSVEQGLDVGVQPAADGAAREGSTTAAAAESLADDAPASVEAAAAGGEAGAASQDQGGKDDAVQRHSQASSEAAGRGLGSADAGEAGASGSSELVPTPQQYMQLAKLRTHFHKDLRKQLYTGADDKEFFEYLKQEVKVVEKRLDESRVALQHLEMHLINTACDDPGASIGMQMALPILQERLDAKALEHAAALANLAESEIIRMELEQQAREAAERERRLKAKQSKKDKVRTEREKMAAEKAAERAIEEERRAVEEARLRQQEEEERKKRLELLELARREEEEYLERRRKELLSDENGYWRRRMDADVQAAGAASGPGLAAAPTEKLDGDGAGSQDAPCTPPQQEKADALPNGPATASPDEQDEESTGSTRQQRVRQGAAEAAAGAACCPASASGAPQVSGAAGAGAGAGPRVYMQAEAPGSSSAGPGRVPEARPGSGVLHAGPERGAAAAQPPASASPALQQEPGAAGTGTQAAPRCSGSGNGSGDLDDGRKVAGCQLPAPDPSGAGGKAGSGGGTPAPPAAAAAAHSNGVLPSPVITPSIQSLPRLLPASPQLAAHPGASFPAAPLPGSSPAAGPGPGPRPPPAAAMMMHPVVLGMAAHPPPPAPGLAMLPQPPPVAYAMMPGPRPPMQLPMQRMTMGPQGPVMPMIPGTLPASPSPQGAAGMAPLGMLSMPGAYAAPGPSAGPGSLQGPMMHSGGGMAPPPHMFMYGGHGGHGHAPGSMMHGGGGMMHMMPHAPHPPPHEPSPAWAGPMQHLPHGPPAGPPMSAPPPHPAPQPLQPMGGDKSKSAGVSAGKPTSLSIGAKPFVPSGIRPSSGAPPPPPPQQQQQQHAQSNGVPGSMRHDGMYLQNAALAFFMQQQQLQQQQQQQQHMLMSQQQQYMMSMYSQQQQQQQQRQQQQQQQQQQEVAHCAGSYAQGGSGSNGQAEPDVRPADFAALHSRNAGCSNRVNGDAQPLQPGGQPVGVPEAEPRQEQRGVGEAGAASGSREAGEGSLRHSGSGREALGAARGPSAPAATDAAGARAGPGAGPGAGLPQADAEAPSCEPRGALLSPLTPLDHAEVSDSSQSTADEQHEQRAAVRGAGSSARIGEEGADDVASFDARTSRPEAAPADGSMGGLGGSTTPQQHPRPGLGADEGQGQGLGSSLASSASSPTLPLSKNGSWCSVLVGDGDAANSYASPAAPGGGGGGAAGSSAASSCSNLSAMAANGGAGQGTWKQKLQQNMMQQQQQQQQQQRGVGQIKASPGAAPQPSKSLTPLPQQQPQPAAFRRAGSRTGAALMSEPRRPLPGRLAKLADGRLVFYPSSPGAGDSWPHELEVTLARSMQNRGSQNNCFLNVIVQSLWHLSCFREPMLRMALELCESNGSSPGDKRVMAAIWRIFRSMACAPGDSSAGEPGPSGVAGASVSPQELREALCSQSPIHVDPSEMQDAGEVFGEILGILHRADLGLPEEGLLDLQLPVRVKVRAGAAADGCAATPAVEAAAAAATPEPATLVHRVFGLDVQVPCAAEDPSGGPEDFLSADTLRRGGSRAAQYKRSNGAASPASAPGGGGQAAAAAAAAGAQQGSGGGAAASSSGGGAWQSSSTTAAKRLQELGVHEVQQFTKFFHLLPAQALRKAGAALPSASFEEVLAEAEACGTPQPQSQSPAQAQRQSAGGGALPKAITLLRRPAVFTLSIVWESPQAPQEAIRGTVEALGCELELSEVFRIPARAGGSGGSPPLFRLRCVVCYLGHHYLVYALSQELGLWLLLDDEEVALAGQWADVCRAMVARRLQPSLLFFECSEPVA